MTVQRQVSEQMQWHLQQGIPDHFGVLADDVKLEHIPALHTFHHPQRHLQGTEGGHGSTAAAGTAALPTARGAQWGSIS